MTPHCVGTGRAQDEDAEKFAQETVGYVTWTGPMVEAARR